MRSIEHSHTIVKIVQNVVFTSHAVMMTLNKIDEMPPWPHNFVRLSRQPQGSSRPAFFMCRPLKSYSSYFIVSIMPHLSSASLTKNVVSCMILHLSILFCRLISISHKLKCVTTQLSTAALIVRDEGKQTSFESQKCHP